MTLSPLLIDAAGQARLRLQHERSGLAKSNWVMPTPRWAILSCSGSGEEYEVESEELGSSPNTKFCALIHDIQKRCDIRLRQIEPETREVELIKTVHLFISDVLNTAGKPLLNCKADEEKSFELCLELENSVSEILNGSLASTQIERWNPILSSLHCGEQMDAIAA